MRPTQKVLNLSNLKAQTKKLAAGMLKLRKSYNRPLCTYLMSYDANIQSRPRSRLKWYIYQTVWEVIFRIPIHNKRSTMLTRKHMNTH